jgi:alpha-tubulin suppressor-like RCC1 family protein
MTKYKPHRNSLVLALATFIHSSCFDSTLFFQQPGKSSLTNNEFVQAASTEADGVVIAKLDSQSTATQLISVSNSSAIQSSRVAIPAGALSVDTDITMEEGGNIASQSTSSELGLSGNSFAESGAAVIIESSVAMDTTKPLTISIPLPAGARLRLTGDQWENLVVIYRVVSIAENGVNKSGLITGDNLVVNPDGTVSFPTTHFGIFQAVVTAIKVEKAVEVVSERPILSKREEKKDPEAIWSAVNQNFSTASRIMSLAATVSAVSSVSDCAIRLDDDKALPFSSVRSTHNSPSLDYQATSQDPENFFVQFECTDNFGRTTSSEWAEVTIPLGDKEPPAEFFIAAPTGVVTDPLITVSWGAAKDASKYNLVISKNEDCSLPTYSKSDLTGTTHEITTALPPGTTWHTCMSASDQVGNNREASNNGLSFTVADPEPATTILTQPTPVTGTLTANFTFSCDGSCTYEYRMDSKASWTASGATLGIVASEGSNTIAVRAVTTNGSIDATPATYTWIVDTIAPIAPAGGSLKTTLLVPSGPNALLANSSLFYFVWGAGTDAGTSIASYTIEYFASSACSTGAISVPGLMGTDYAFAGGVDGSTYSFRVTARDAAGNSSVSACSGNIVVDLTAPLTSILTTPTGISTDSNPAFTFNGSDAGSGVQYFKCALDGGSFATCTSPKTFAGLSDGAHTVAVRAVDNANNIGNPDSYSWTIDAAIPTISSVSSAGGIFIIGQYIDFTVTFSEPTLVTGTPYLSLDIGGSAVSAVYLSGAGGTDLIFRHTVVAGQAGAVTAASSSIALNGGTITDGSGNAATLSYSASFSTTVDGIQPVITSGGTLTTGQHTAGENIQFSIIFSEAVTVTSVPRLSLDIGGSAVYANYYSGSGTNTLIFQYAVLPGQNDLDGVTMAGSLDLNTSGLIRDGNGNNADLTFSPGGSGLYIDSTAPSTATGLYVAADLLGGGPTNFDNDTQVFFIWSPATDSAGLASNTLYRYNLAGCGGSAVVTSGLGSGVSDQSFTAPGGGTYSFKVEAFDTAGNAALSACSPDVTIDVVAPTAPSALTARADSAVGTDVTSDDDLAGFYFVWNPATDAGSGIASYDLKKYSLPLCAGTSIDTNTLANSTNYQLVSTVLPEATYSFKIVTYDVAGNSTVSSCSSDMYISVPAVVLTLSPDAPAVLNVINAVSPGPGTTFTLQNSGVNSSTTLNFAGALSGTNPGSFQLSANTCGATLAAASTCTFEVRAVRSQDGSYAGILTVGDGTYSSNSVTLSGTAGGFYAAPATSLISISSGSVVAGSSETVMLTSKDLAGNPYSIGGNTVVFNVSGGTSTGNFSAVTDVGNGTYTASFTGNFSGTATAIGATINSVAVSTTLPTITVVPGLASTNTSIITVNQPSIILGSTSTITLVAKDAQGNQLTTGGATVSFNTSGGGTSSGTRGTVTDNGNGTYTAIFTGTGQGTPRAIGGTIAAASISSTLPTIQVTGPALLLVSDPGPYGEVNVDRSRSFPVTITNSGDTAATAISISGLPGAWSRINDNCGSSLAAMTSCSFDVIFAPGSLGANSATLTINYNNGLGAATPVTRALSGTGINCPGAHRYWSISRPDAPSNAGWSLAEVRMYEERIDVAAAMPSVIIVENPDGSQSFVTDDNIGTSWTDSASGSTEPYLMFDLGSPKCIKKVDAYTTDAASLGRVLVESSDDQVAWTPVWSFVLKATGQVSPSNIYMGIDRGPVLTFQKVVAGFDSTCALTTDGRPVCWGNNSSGQGGTGNAAPTVQQDATLVNLSGLPVDERTFTKISVGAGFACGISISHNAYCWGDQTNGRLGNGAGSGLSYIPVLVDVSGLPASKKFKSISSGVAHTCAVNMDGNVYCWGDKTSGKLGNGAASGYSALPIAISPGAISSNSRLLSVATAANSTCALDTEGKIYCWGDNSDGQLGDGTSTMSTTPVATVIGTNSYIAISGGINHMCAIQGNGIGLCWGGDALEQLGNGASGGVLTPSPVSSNPLPVGSTFVQIDAGGNHSCGLLSSGASFCWGNDSNGQLGHGYAGSSPYPDPVDMPAELTNEGFTSISAGIDHSCGITGSGQLFCWGSDTNGQLGNGASSGFGVPHPISASNVMGMPASKEMALGHDFGCDLAAFGAIFCSGNNSLGQLGNGGISGGTTSPVPINDGMVTGVKSFRSIAAGNFHSCGLTAENNLFCWGSGTSGQLGQGSGSVSSADPVAVDTINLPTNVRFQSIALGDGHSCGVASNGMAFCWGNGTSGRLGTGNTTNYNRPEQVLNTNLAAGEKFKSVALGMNHSCGLTTVGNVFCWGDDLYGQLGNGTGSTSPVTLPVAIETAAIANVFDRKFVSIYAGPFHTCAINAVGKAFCWGDDFGEKLGNGTGSPNLCNGSDPCAASPIPVNDTALGTEKSFVKLALGRNSSCGLAVNGTMFCWGDDTNGQQGNGAGASVIHSPTLTSGMANASIADLASGYFYACQVGSNSMRRCWGENASGQFGNGSTTSTDIPSMVDAEHLRGSVCPKGYVLVAGVAEYGTADFCIAKYEMKNQTGAVSTAAGLPYTSVPRSTAQSECAALSSDHHLLTNSEYMSIARSIEYNSQNWSTTSYGAGLINMGHSDGTPAAMLAAIGGDNSACFGTGETCDAMAFNDQRRTHALSNGSVLWDFAGNVGEWVDFPGAPTDCAAAPLEFSSSGCSAGVRRDVAPSVSTFSSGQGMGQIYGGSGSSVIRGGAWDDTDPTSMAGIYSIRLDASAGSNSSSVGFRCAKSIP